MEPAGDVAGPWITSDQTVVRSLGEEFPSRPAPGPLGSRSGRMAQAEALMRRALIGLWAWTVMAASAPAIDVVKPFKAESDLVRYAYHYELLDSLLERTVARYGPYVMEPYTEPISSARGWQEGLRGELLNVLFSDVGHRIIDEGMIPIPYPVDKGLLGYRICFIVKQDQARIDRIDSIDELRSLTVGQGRDWGDVKIFEYNRIPIDSTSTYESLFAMLARGRFDLFPRGATEIQQEMAAYGPKYPDLAIDQHLLIRYPFPQFFYVSKSAPRLAARLRDGFEQMIRDGSFDALFDRHFGKSLRDLRLDRRVIIDLENPFLPSWVPLDRKELWVDIEALKRPFAARRQPSR